MSSQRFPENAKEALVMILASNLKTVKPTKAEVGDNTIVMVGQYEDITITVYDDNVVEFFNEELEAVNFKFEDMCPEE